MNNFIKISLLCGAALFGSNVSAASYKFTDLSKGDDTSRSIAHAINNKGDIVGYTSVIVPFEHGIGSSFVATLWDKNGVDTLLNTPTFTGSSIAYDINNSGKIGGNYMAPIQITGTSAAVWKNTEMTLVSKGNPDDSRIVSINSKGEMVGYTKEDFTIWDKHNVATTPSIDGRFIANSINDKSAIAGGYIKLSDIPNVPTLHHAAIYKDGKIIDIGTLGVAPEIRDGSNAMDINNHGVVVGNSAAISLSRGFVWEDGEMSVLQYIKGFGGYTEALAINEHNQIVGTSVSKHGEFQHATLWNGTKAYDLNDFMSDADKLAGWVLTTANDINDHGWVVGDAFNTLTNETHAYLLSTRDPISPIPEPTTWAMLLGGLGLLGFVGIRSKSI